MRAGEVAILIIVVMSFLVGLFFYGGMPEMMASHWNARGEVDGFMSKAWALFLMPVISLVLGLLMIFIIRLDPLRDNIEKFRKHYELTIVVFMLFLFYLYFLTIYWNLGYHFNMVIFLAPAFGVLFYFMGILVSNSRQNYMIGIRTPWTLANVNVWDKTHKLGGILFRIAGILAFLGMFFEEFAFLLIVVPIIIFALFLIVYSYFAYRKEMEASWVRSKNPINLERSKVSRPQKARTAKRSKKR